MTMLIAAGTLLLGILVAAGKLAKWINAPKVEAEKTARYKEKMAYRRQRNAARQAKSEARQTRRDALKKDRFARRLAKRRRRP